MNFEETKRNAGGACASGWVSDAAARVRDGYDWLADACLVVFVAFALGIALMKVLLFFAAGWFPWR